MGWIIIGCLLALIIDFYIATEFNAVAEQKGYYSAKYLWICFFLGIVGYLLVIALPDISMETQSATKKVAPDYLRKYAASEQPKDPGKSRISGNEKTCAFCGQKQPATYTHCMQCGEKI